MNDRNHRSVQRDFRGYASEPPHADWPNDAKVAVSFVVNVEEGAELSIADGDEKNEFEYEEILEIENAPDFCMESHFEYGTRAGYWRIMDLLGRYGVKATMNICARAVKRSPWLAQDALRRGHEMACHGYRWFGPVYMPEWEERRVIDQCVEEIRQATGTRPIGWHSRSTASANTRRLLVEEGGFLYDSDAYNDDLPQIVNIHDRAHIVLPYCFDTNDMRFFQSFGFVHADDFSRYCVDAFDWLWREGEKKPKMMTIGLHLRIIGRPGRISGLEAFLRHITEKGRTWIARREEIARHWASLHELPIEDIVSQ